MKVKLFATVAALVMGASAHAQNLASGGVSVGSSDVAKIELAMNGAKATLNVGVGSIQAWVLPFSLQAGVEVLGAEVDLDGSGLIEAGEHVLVLSGQAAADVLAEAKLIASDAASKAKAAASATLVLAGEGVDVLWTHLKAGANTAAAWGSAVYSVASVHAVAAKDFAVQSLKKGAAWLCDTSKAALKKGEELAAATKEEAEELADATIATAKATWQGLNALAGALKAYAVNKADCFVAFSVAKANQFAAAASELASDAKAAAVTAYHAAAAKLCALSAAAVEEAKQAQALVVTHLVALKNVAAETADNAWEYAKKGAKFLKAKAEYVAAKVAAGALTVVDFLDDVIVLDGDLSATSAGIKVGICDWTVGANANWGN